MKYTFRIKKNKDFRFILKRGKFYRGKYVNLYYIDNKVKSNSNMFGICVSKKNGKAVNRNKLKRWIREAYKLQEINIKKNISIVVLYKKSTTVDNINFYLIYNDLKNCLEGLDLYENNK